MQQERVPVLVVGGGVVGLTASLFLAEHGVRSTLVERHPGTSIYPRARGVNGRTMELLRELGVESKVRKAGAKLSPAVGLLSGTTLADVLRAQGKGNWIMRKIRARGMLGQETKKSPTSACRCTQEDLEPILLEEARARGVEAHFSTELVSFESDTGGVTATLLDRTSGAKRSLRADYLVAADGARSRIREELGVPLSGDALAGHQLNVYFRADLRKLVEGREFSMCLVDNPEVRGLFASIDNASLWVFHLAYYPHKGESPEQFGHARCADLVKRALGMPDIEIEVKHVSPWQSAVRLAESYSRGRVFLAGDAAHTMPPWGGFGANTGIQDAHNLTWKLAAVLAGRAGDDLLSTYQEERLPVARAVSAIAASLNDERGLMKVGSPFGMLWAMRKVFPYLSIGYGYASSAIVLERGGRPGPGSTDLRGRSGTRAPHLWLERNGDRISTLDLFGRSFVLLTSEGGAPWRAAARRISERLDVAIESVTVDRDVRDRDGRWRSAYGVKAAGASLVRPDGIVAWRSAAGAAQPDAVIEGVLARILSRPSLAATSSSPSLTT